MKRTLHKLVKWCYLLIALALILLAVVVQSGRSFSPVLGNYNQDIARYFSDQLNAKVTIGAIQAEWNGLKPSLVVSDLHIHNPADQPIVAIGEARMRFDILKSLRNARLVWSHLGLSQVDMDFVQTAAGSWRIAGLPQRREQDAKGTDINSLVDMLLLSTRIELQSSRFHFAFTSGQQMLLQSPYVLLESAADFHRLALQVDVDGQPRSVYLVLEAEGDPRKPARFRSKGYLQLNSFPTGEPVAAATAFLLGDAGKSVIQSEGSLDANIWFESRAGGKGYDLSGRLDLQRLSVPFAERRLALDDFTTDLTGYWLPGGEWRLGLQGLTAAVQSEKIDEMNIAFSASGYNQVVKVNMDSLDLAGLTSIVTRSGVLPEGRLAEVLTSLSPRGELRNIVLSLPPKAPAEWQLSANLEQLAVGAWRGVPALTGVDGYLQAGQKGGFVDIDSRRGFSMHYSPTFAGAMDYDRARGQVAWHLQRDKNQIYVNSGLLEFQKGDELARGYMWLGLPWQRNTGNIDLYLQIGGQQVSASRYRTYVPQTLPEPLRKWLGDSLGEANPGIAKRVGFIYRGTLNTPNPLARTAQLTLDLDGVSLDYHPGWPALSDIKGQLSVSDVHVSAQVSSAKVLESQIEQASIKVNPRAQGRGSLLQVDGEVKGPAADGIRVLREGQMRQYLGSSLDSWSMQGDMLARLDLDIPLGSGEQKPADARQQVDVDLQVPFFELQNLNLSVGELSGNISYNSTSGIASKDLQGTFFGEPLLVSLASDKAKGANKTLIDLQGRVDAEQLALWSKRPEALFLKGVMPYEAQVELNHQVGSRAQANADAVPPSPREFAAQSFARVTLNSNLAGVAVDLPAPYGKAANEERPLKFSLWLQEAQSQIRVDYNRDVQALLRMDRGNNNQLLNANIALAEDARLGDKAQFLVSGFLPGIDLDAWKAVQARYLAYAERLTPVVVRPLVANAGSNPVAAVDDQIGKVAGLPFLIELVLGEYELGPMTLENLAVTAMPVAAGWQLAVRNPVVEGDLFVPASPFVAMDVNLRRLSLDSVALGLSQPAATAPSESINTGAPDAAEPASAEVVEAVSVIDPRRLPRANISIESLLLDNKDYGTWSLALRPDDLGVVIDKIRGTIRGVTVSGIDDNPDEPEQAGARLIWHNTEVGVQTRFIGRLRAGDMGAVLRDWQKPDMLESTAASYDADLFWPGSPQDFKILNLGGEMTIAMENGRFKRDAGAGEGILRLMSILNFDSLARRLRLDFSDLYKSGLAYDQITGKVRFNQGTLVFEEPLVVTTPSSGMQMAGTIDLRRERLNTRLVASLPVAGNVTFYAALAAGLPAAAGIYVVSKLFKKQVDQATSVSYTIKGSWDEPKMRFDRLFESEQSLRDSVNKKRAGKEPKTENRRR
ncbi:YhdP family protein [Cellvibrio fontiphilus]|uniref:YhdP family protein n=1 Tax=Cellvibrio fontiphilus TaxID=1815559 RepID=A0ABV7F982_9GAMM